MPTGTLLCFRVFALALGPHGPSVPGHHNHDKNANECHDRRLRNVEQIVSAGLRTVWRAGNVEHSGFAG